MNSCTHSQRLGTQKIETKKILNENLEKNIGKDSRNPALCGEIFIENNIPPVTKHFPSLSELAEAPTKISSPSHSKNIKKSTKTHRPTPSPNIKKLYQLHRRQLPSLKQLNRPTAHKISVSFSLSLTFWVWICNKTEMDHSKLDLGSS